MANISSFFFLNESYTLRKFRFIFKPENTICWHYENKNTSPQGSTCHSYFCLFVILHLCTLQIFTSTFGDQPISFSKTSCSKTHEDKENEGKTFIKQIHRKAKQSVACSGHYRLQSQDHWGRESTLQPVPVLLKRCSDAFPFHLDGHVLFCLRTPLILQITWIFKEIKPTLYETTWPCATLCYFIGLSTVQNMMWRPLPEQDPGPLCLFCGQVMLPLQISLHYQEIRVTNTECVHLTELL